MIIPVKLNEDRYEVTVENGILKRAGELLRLDRMVFIVTDSGVPVEYSETVAKQCRESYIYTIPQGEKSKSFEMLEILLSKMLDLGMTRSDCVVAVGGGVVGDLAGFAASCYLRGVDFYNVPTTLLSQVDSSVGGKTGINLSGVKNAVGAFYQPEAVIIDPETLRSLPQRLKNEGMAEAVKMALTCDAELFEMIERGSALEYVIERSLKIKADVVERDEKESGLRRVLNFGHTVGHAIESVNRGSLLHGECVALGMLPMCSDDIRKRLVKVLEKYSLPTAITNTADELLPYILHDKKKNGDRIAAVLTERVGEYKMCELTAEEICARVEAVK